jgi:hypothetical protein
MAAKQIECPVHATWDELCTTYSSDFRHAQRMPSGAQKAQHAQHTQHRAVWEACAAVHCCQRARHRRDGARAVGGMQGLDRTGVDVRGTGTCWLGVVMPKWQNPTRELGARVLPGFEAKAPSRYACLGMSCTDWMPRLSTEMRILCVAAIRKQTSYSACQIGPCQIGPRILLVSVMPNRTKRILLVSVMPAVGGLGYQGQGDL